MQVTPAKEHFLAIDGGRPVRKTLLPYSHQSIDEEDIQAVVDVLRSEWITTGPKVVEFENAFSDYVDSSYAISFSSGTAALHGAVFAAGLRHGDEVVTTPMTFCATANCVIYQGGRPIFADISNDTLNIDPDEIVRHLTPKTKAIIPVDYAGHPADLDPICELAGDKKLLVIEDGCHALGARYKNKFVGSISDMTVFSFHPAKHITTGEGGMVTTNDEKLAKRLKLFRNHGIESDARQRQAIGQWHYEMTELGYNYRLSDISCALGLSQLRKIDKNLSRRREIASRYRTALRNITELILPAEKEFVVSSWHLYPIRLDLKSLKTSRAKFFAALRAENIGVNVHYIPVHYHPYYMNHFGCKRGEYPITESAYESMISLPMFHSMTDIDISDVIDAVKKVTDNFAPTKSSRIK